MSCVARSQDEALSTSQASPAEAYDPNAVNDFVRPQSDDGLPANRPLTSTPTRGILPPHENPDPTKPLRSLQRRRATSFTA